MLSTTTDSLEIQLEQGLLVKHPEFWFTDGSLILRAHSTLFRVHVSQLCRKSIFFRDLFSLPQPQSSTPDREERRLEGCPVLDLHDPPDDVANLVKVIYDGPNFGNNDREDFAAVSGVLRLSTKYLIEESIRSKAMAHIRSAWPSTLKAWDLREDLARTHEVETGDLRGLRYPHPIAIINLAREIGADELLPSAFYELSRYSFTQIFEPSPGDPLDPHTPPSARVSLSYTLSPADMQRLALGKEAAQQAVTTLIQNMEHASADHPSHRRSRSGQHIVPAHPPGIGGRVRANCVTPAACRKDLAELVELATQHYLFDRERGCADPLYVAEELGQLKSAEFADCTACAHALEAWAARERERLWRAIPDWFRLRR
ncbi:hypothetical protein OH76DRAFT_1362071 [Lentinus brumalis]|uniref:BTB domain-containing protein n=1 Tax=Lentinus brumalis TaxID=2498619 RepID=A0A371CRF7_9APHY|nr:hypothetical protein OH76DRAFT_1362071 [Polyporus brumalis]